MKVHIVPIDYFRTVGGVQRETGGGYCEKGIIYVDELKSPKDKRLIAIHEVLCHRLDPWITSRLIPHSFIDTIVEDIISVEDQL